MSHQQSNPSNDNAPDSVDPPSEPKGKRHVIFMVIATLVIISAGYSAYKYLNKNKVRAKKSQILNYTPTVDVVTVERVSFAPIIELTGEVSPATQTDIISEVTGAIVYMSDTLEVGNIFEAGEVILRINDADYRTQLANAQASLADAELLLAQERARAVQSMRDWKTLGKGRPASDLVQRIPQIKSAKARIEAAQATIDKARRDIEKTSIRAPYRCMVSRKFIDQGSYLSTMGKVASIYSVSDYEIRLPLSLDKVHFLSADNGVGSEIGFFTKVGERSLNWSGKVERLEGGIDTQTFSMVMVGSVKPNPSQGLFTYPPKGLFIDAKIKGRTIEKVIKIPRLALRENQKIWVLSANNLLSIADAEIVREEKNHIYINSKIRNGADVIVSPIAVPVEGMELKRTKPRATKNGAENTEINHS